MADTELKKNLPHMLAVAVLLFALLIICTKAGFISCSSLGKSYCDIYYGVTGKPTVLLIRGDSGMGSPDTLARMIEATYRLPVEKMDISKVSRGTIEGYSLIIVEHAKAVPTETLKAFYDYLFEDLGRIVWVGDAGTLGTTGDQLCKNMEFTIEWRTDAGKQAEQYTESICVSETEAPAADAASISDMISIKRDALVNKAVSHMAELCSDAFDGALGVKTSTGYPCDGSSYSDTLFKWTNEAAFKAGINPWARGEYEKLSTAEAQGGIDFGKSVLGVGFVADDYAVQEFNAYYDSIDTVRAGLAKAHAGFVACAKSLQTTGCDATTKAATVRADLARIKNQKDDAETTLSTIATTLDSIALQKQAKTEPSSAISAASTKIKGYKDEIRAITVDTETATLQDIDRYSAINDYLAKAKEPLVQLRGDEIDTAVKANYDSQINTLDSKIASLDTATAALAADLAAYNECAGQQRSTVLQVVGDSPEMEQLIAYASPLVDEDGALDFIRIAKGDEWAALADRLQAVDVDCGGQEFTDGMTAAASAIRAAQAANAAPGSSSDALAVMQVADAKHPLVEGLTQSIDLKKDGYPVPFVLVETTEADSHSVVQLRVTPAYKGISTWPGITIKDPRFATHMFGKGVVVYYAFPPETDELFVKNLVEFMLY